MMAAWAQGSLTPDRFLGRVPSSKPIATNPLAWTPTKVRRHDLSRRPQTAPNPKFGHAPKPNLDLYSFRNQLVSPSGFLPSRQNNYRESDLASENRPVEGLSSLRSILWHKHSRNHSTPIYYILSIY